MAYHKIIAGLHESQKAQLRTRAFYSHQLMTFTLQDCWQSYQHNFLWRKKIKIARSHEWLDRFATTYRSNVDISASPLLSTCSGFRIQLIGPRPPTLLRKFHPSSSLSYPSTVAFILIFVLVDFDSLYGLSKFNYLLARLIKLLS